MKRVDALVVPLLVVIGNFVTVKSVPKTFAAPAQEGTEHAPHQPLRMDGGFRAFERSQNTMTPYTSTARVVAKLSADDFIPDGNLNKKVWREAEWVRFDNDMSGREHFPQAETEVATFWTSTHLYFAYRCKYSRLNIYEGENPLPERWELWMRDVVELFINPTPARVNHYYEFEVAPNNQWLDLEIDKDKTPFANAAWNSGFEHATRIDPARHVWTCEMRIPLSAFGVHRLEPGAEWRANFYRADGEGDDNQRRLMSWSAIPEGRTFHVPTRFGILKFNR